MRNNAILQSDTGIDEAVVEPVHRLPSKKRKPNARRIAFLIHSYIGLKLSLLFALVLLTGAIAVFADEIDWLFYSEIRVSPQGEKLNEGELFDRIKMQMPDVGFASLTTTGGSERRAANALMTLPDGGFKKVWADPYTGEITGITGFLTVGTFLSLLHTTLYIPVIGRAFVNFFGLLCLLGLVTGLISYRKFWREFFKIPRLNRNLRVALSDLHKLIGLWSLWFVLIIGMTGSWWFYQNPLVLYKVAPQFLPEKAIDPALTNEDLDKLSGTIPTPLSHKDIITIVNNHDPNFDVHFLIPPEHNGMAYSVRGSKRDLLTSKFDSNYFINPYTGEILGQRLAEDMSAIVRIDRSMAPLHYGSWGYEGLTDLLVKAIWFIFGLAMTGLSISGLIIYYQRSKKITKKFLPKNTAKRYLKRFWLAVRPWGGPMSVFKYLNWAFIAVMCIGISIAFTLQREGTSGSGYLYMQQDVGEWTVSLNATLGLLEKDLDPIQPGRQTTINAFVKKGNSAAIKFMHVKVRKPRTTRAPGAVIHGSLGNQHAHVSIPKKLNDGDRIWLTIEDWEGQFHQISWPLMPDGNITIDMRKVAKSQDLLSANQPSSDQQ